MWKNVYSTSFILIVLIMDNADSNDGHELAEVMKAPLIHMAKGCMAKVSSATEEDIMKIKYDPPYPNNTACLIKCLLEKIQIISKGKYSRINFMTAITPLVMSNASKFEHMKHVANQCDKEIPEAKSESDCDIGNNVVSCLFKYAPELHIKI